MHPAILNNEQATPSTEDDVNFVENNLIQVRPAMAPKKESIVHHAMAFKSECILFFTIVKEGGRCTVVSFYTAVSRTARCKKRMTQ